MKAIQKDNILLILIVLFFKWFPNPVKPFVSVLSPEAMEKYNGPAQPKCKSLDYITMFYIIVKTYNK